MARLSILIYHRVLDSPDPFRPGDIDAVTFQTHVSTLSRWFNIVPLRAAVRGLKNGTLPRRAVSITFDDGYSDNHTKALPILAKSRCSATFFVATGFLDGGCMWNDVVIEAIRTAPGESLDLSRLGLGCHGLESQTARVRAAYSIIRALKHLPIADREQTACDIAGLADCTPPTDLMMDSEQVRELAACGMEVGGHTVSHPILRTLDDDAARLEILEGRGRLEEITQRPVELFAYPNGKPGEDYTDRDVELVKGLGFEAAVSTSWGTARRGSSVYELPRIGPWDRNGSVLAARLSWYRLRA